MFGSGGFREFASRIRPKLGVLGFYGFPCPLLRILFEVAGLLFPVLPSTCRREVLAAFGHKGVFALPPLVPRPLLTAPAKALVGL